MAIRTKGSQTGLLSKMNDIVKFLNNNEGVITAVSFLYLVLLPFIGPRWSFLAAILFPLVFILNIDKPIELLLITKVPVYVVLFAASVLLAIIYLSYFFWLKFSKLTILEALYGASGNREDLTGSLNERVRDNRLDTKLTNSLCNSGRDPAPHMRKTCTIKYQVGKKIRTAVYEENDQIKLPKRRDLLWLF